jgi:hypothetical protein
MTGREKPAIQTRFGFMRLTRLLCMYEVRRTGDSETQANRRPSLPGAQSIAGVRGAWGDWRRNVPKCKFVNQGYLSWCWKEQGRRQSPHSSGEAGNDRGAKEDRKVEA